MTDKHIAPDSPALTKPDSRLALGLAAKLVLVMTCLTVVVLVSFWLSVRQQLGPTLQRQADDLGNILVSQTAESITELVLANDQLSLNVVLNQLSGNDAIANVTVFNVDNELIASAGDPLPPNSSGNSVYNASIALQDSIAGTVRLTLAPGLVASGLDRYRLYFWIVLTLGVGLSITAGLALSGNIIRPLRQVSTWLADPLEAEPVYDETRNDELGILLAESARLVRELQAENPTLHLSQNETAETGTEEIGQRLFASVLTVHARNIETALDLLHPHTLARLLEEFRYLAKQTAKLYGGKIYQFTGTSVNIVYDAGDNTDHAFNAVCSAQLFRLLMHKINAVHRDKGSPSLEFTFGLDTGDLLQSGTGDDCAYIGRTLKTSTALSTHGLPGQLLISSNTFTLAGDQERLRSLERLDVISEADNEPYIAYILDDDMGSYTELLHRQADHIVPNSGQSSLDD